MKHFLAGICLLSFVVVSKGQVSIKVSMPPIVPNSDITIEVRINKGNVSNFAKYQIDVPPGVYISEGDNKTGSFSFENNRAKIIWVSIPPDPEFTITMKLNPGTATGMGTINQKFYYLENGTRKEVEAVPINVDFSGGGSPVTANTESTKEPEPAKADPVVETSAPPTSEATPTTGLAAASNTIAETISDAAPSETPTAHDASKAKESSEETIRKLKEQFDAVNSPPAENKAPARPSAPASAASENPATSMVYKVQIGAYGEKPGLSKYSSVKGVNILKEDNFYKVLVGNFKNRDEAVKKKDELLAKGFKGFIVTYQNGVRVK